MSPPKDALALADLCIRAGLLSQLEVQDVWEELGKKGEDIEPFLKVLERKGQLTSWQIQKLLKGDTDGMVLGGYRIRYKISSGSFGRVFRADDPRTGRVVAVKVLRRKWSEDKSKNVIELFEREGRMGMTLRHQNIVEILAVNRDPTSKQYFIVMEFVEGGNLREILNIRKKIEPAEALKILEDATAGLAYAFSRGVTHRDMKASNILISSQKEAKLVDFGLAEVGEGSLSVASARGDKEEDMDVSRTVDYAGLELATGVPHGDTRSDIFFLGCVAYQMLTGREPMEMTRNAKSRMEKGRFTKIPKIAKEEINGPPTIIRLVENMISLDPTKRFQTPSQLLEAIREVRRELEGGADNGKAAAAKTYTLFLVEKDERLQDVLREKFKEKGFRVLLAANPSRARERFRQQPFDVLIVNCMTEGEEGLIAFDEIMKDATNSGLGCSGILLLAGEQADWQNRVANRPHQAIMSQPIKFKQLLHKVCELLKIAER